MIPQEQGSQQWLQWRKKRVGASDAPVIAGVSPYKSIGQLWEEKLGIRSDEEPNEHMIRGKEMEEEARQCAEKILGKNFFPHVVGHPKLEWMFASLDGETMEHDAIIEIKCPGGKDHAIALKGQVPEKYVPQLQHIMSVTGYDEIFYFSYRDGSGKIIRHARDEAYIDKIIEKERRFHVLLMKGFDEIEKHDHRIEAMKDELYRILE